MAIGDIFSAPVEKLALGGDGLALYNGKKVFIPLAAPGDLLRARITEDHGNWARGEITGLEAASPLRTKPRCPLFGDCGGCSLQHLSYESQLTVKQEMFTSTLIHTGGAQSLPECTVVPSPPWEYRNRISLHAIRANRGPRCGFKARKSNAIIPIEDCPIADPLIRTALNGIKPPPGKDRFTLYARGRVLLSEDGTEIGTITLLEKQIDLSAACFFQSNAAMLEKIIPVLRGAAERAVESVAGSSTDRMADLYAGVGTFSLFLADLFSGGADLLEENPGALKLAKINLDRAQPGGQFRFFPQKDEQWIKKQRLEDYTFAVADPPRQGLSPALAKSFVQGGPPVLAYVSCDPASFARDYRILKQAYTLEQLQLFDFYPQTAHIESLGIFTRNSRK